MKLLIGRRENYNPEFRPGSTFVQFILGGRARPTVIEYPGKCSTCSSPVTITLREDTNTGEIWLEGPERCVSCGQQFSNESAAFQPLDQEAICGLFGAA
jgi:DNA-directed RNA polymerase subunit RPC12/RpoP